MSSGSGVPDTMQALALTGPGEFEMREAPIPAPAVAASPKVANRLAVGTRVAGEAHCGYGTCANCLSGHYTICQNYGDAAAGQPALRLHHSGSEGRRSVYVLPKAGF